MTIRPRKAGEDEPTARTAIRHRCARRASEGVRENPREGTRQNDPVPSVQGVLPRKGEPHFILVVRMIFSWIQAFSRDWQPSGILLVIAESVFTVTDPPLKFLQRFIPSLRLGMVAIDLSFMVLFIVVLIMLEVVVPAL